MLRYAPSCETNHLLRYIHVQSVIWLRRARFLITTNQLMVHVMYSQYRSVALVPWKFTYGANSSTDGASFFVQGTAIEPFYAHCRRGKIPRYTMRCCRSRPRSRYSASFAKPKGLRPSKPQQPKNEMTKTAHFARLLNRQRYRVEGTL